MTDLGFALALHGGAGASRKLDYAREHEHMRFALELGRDVLSRDGSALDAVVAVVTELEESGLYVAGKGGSPNLAGEYELDACLMEGHTRRAGAVAGLRGFKSPIQVARLVMERTPHVMLCGQGAEQFAQDCGAAMISDEASWFTNACAGEANYAPMSHGTVGCVARDKAGHVAAATSTAGVFDKTPGRVGDSPLIGAGAWADDNVAVSCTGQGELFIKTAAAAQVAFHARAGVNLAEAASRVIAEIASMNGDGGLIAIDHGGNIAVPYRSEGFKRAALSRTGEVSVRVFDDD